jgi:hypothetical protein
MSAETHSASSSLIQAVQQYCDELESLNNSFRQVMALLHVLAKSGNKKLEEFIAEHGKDLTIEEHQRTFNIEINKRSDWINLNRQVKSILSSQQLIPRNLIVALVCTYDSFLGKLIRFILQVKPEILDGSEKVLKFSELMTFADIPSAREYLIEKEVESVLRKSHTDQFKWLESKLGTPFNKNLRSWPNFVELTERRNLFVHCAGVVSSQYLTVCGEHKCTIDPSVKVGSQLHAPPDYFTEAYKCLYEIGIKLSQVIWRKILKGDLEQCDGNLSDVTYSLIERGEYDIAIRILEFFTQPQLNHHNEAITRVLIINLAQANKWNGDNEKCKKVLSAMDWSACEERYRIATHVLNDDFEAAYSSMRLLVHAKDFNKIYYKEWPIFRKIRQESKFAQVFEDCYKEPFEVKEKVVAKEAEAPAKSDLPPPLSAN